MTCELPVLPTHPHPPGKGDVHQAPSDPALPALPYPVTFIARDPKWAPLIADPSLAFDDRMYRLGTSGQDIWSAQLYLDLRRAGLDVYLAAAPEPGRISVIPYHDVKVSDRLYRSYVVACRYDCPHPVLGDQRTVMCPWLVRGSSDHFMLHRPQPLLVPRRAERGTRIEVLAFKGFAYNLDKAFQDELFTRGLSELGVRLSLATEHCEDLFDQWSDYSEADVVLAVRNLSAYELRVKPALKLVNAWLAGVPAILGPEPSYRMLRQSPLDYFEVRTPEEALAALKRLKAEPALYTAMVANGRERAKAFSVDRVTRQWADLLCGPVADGYRQWLAAGPFCRGLRPLESAVRYVGHRVARSAFYFRKAHGQRMF
jgi:hypothetical protein